jgi:1-deoxyxylulose-5-phosphate synthase
MEYRRLGTSGLKVSRIAPGCIRFGNGLRGMTWALDTL